MRKNMKKRLFVVSGIIVVVVIVVLAIVAGGSAAKSLTVAEAASGTHAGEKVQVSGNVVTDSFTIEVGKAVFSLYDPADPTGAKLRVTYEGAVSSTFGNEVSAIVTGRMTEAGELLATELVTKCPSKYESGVDALTVDQILSYGEQVYGKPVKVTGQLAAATLTTPGKAVRFCLTNDPNGHAAGDWAMLDVQYDGALSDGIADGVTLVVTGSMGEDGRFHATDVALEA